jgi:hypothetical protein
MSVLDGLRAIIVKTQSTLAVQAVGPEATEINVSFGDLLMGDDEPGAEDGFGKDIQDGVGDGLAIDREVASSISNTPDTMCR